ncbi:MAG: hypothetical protein Kow00127_11630 [Bacteroidales bacterium]
MKVLKLITVITGFFLITLQAGAQYHYDFTPGCRKAYNAIVSLKFQEGKKLIEQEKAADPDNNIPYLLDNYISFLTVFISEEEPLFKKLEDESDLIFDRLEEGDPESPWYRYSLAQVNLQWAVARLKFKEYVTATFEVNRAYRMLEENREKFPDFLPHYINLGLLHTLIGTIPDNYNWVKKIVGIEGTIDEGVSEILRVLNESMVNPEYYHYKAECLFYLSFIQMNLTTNKAKTLEYINMIRKDSVAMQSPMAVYAIARIYMSNGKTGEAIDILTNRPRSPEYFPFYYLDFLTGLAKLHRLDNDASAWLINFTANFRGINYIKEAYQKLAWYYYIQGDTARYRDYMKKVLENGNDIVDADKQAEREAESGTLPHYHLLRARLLFDGGFYETAFNELNSEEVKKSLRDEKENLEYTYRMGRILDEWGKKEEAVKYYLQTIEKGKESEYYFAANAALKLGMIYEEAGRYDDALRYYELAQNMENKEYRNSINQKAKAGINRIESRRDS